MWEYVQQMLADFLCLPLSDGVNRCLAASTLSTFVCPTDQTKCNWGERQQYLHYYHVGILGVLTDAWWTVAQSSNTNFDSSVAKKCVNMHKGVEKYRY